MVRREVVFVDARRGALDRGWNPDDVERVLEAASIPSRRIRVGSADELLELVDAHGSEILFWPLDYTFDESPRGPTISGVLSRAKATSVGCDSNSTRHTSKLVFKSALRDAGIPTPSWIELPRASTEQLLEKLAYPTFIKSEYSCDSAGVRLAHDVDEAMGATRELSNSFEGRVYAEEAFRRAEWTVGCVVGGTGVIAAAMGIAPRHGEFVDSSAKRDNSRLVFSAPYPKMEKSLLGLVTEIIESLQLAGYFRIDVVESPEGDFAAIDFNGLPSLNSAAAQLSYLPMAFNLRFGMSFESLVHRILASARGVDDAADAWRDWREGEEHASRS